MTNNQQLMKSNYLSGFTAAFTYAITSALARVFVEDIGHQLGPLLPMLFSIVITALFFHLVNLTSWKKIYLAVYQHKKIWCYAMLATTALWCSFFIGPYYIGADDYTILVFAIGGLIGVLNHYKHNRSQPLLVIVVTFFYIAACILAFTGEGLTYRHAIGFAFSMLSGVSFFIFLKSSSELEKKTGLSSSATLAVRWWLILVFMFILSFDQLGKLLIVPLSLYLKMLIPAFFGIILPSYLSQKAAVYIGPRLTAVIQSSTPFFTVMLAASFHSKTASLYDVLASILIAVAILVYQIPALSRKKAL